MTALHMLPITAVFGVLQVPAQEALLASYAEYPINSDLHVRARLIADDLIFPGDLTCTPFGEAVVEQREQL